MIEAALKVLPPSGADRAIAVLSEGGYFVAVADGAGGTGGGASTADRLIIALTSSSVIAGGFSLLVFARCALASFLPRRSSTISRRRSSFA